MKNWWLSKTVWLGVVASAIGAVEIFLRANGMEVPPAVYEYGGIVTGIIIIILRKLTSTPLSSRLKPGK